MSLSCFQTLQVSNQHVQIIAVTKAGASMALKCEYRPLEGNNRDAFEFGLIDDS